MPRAEQKPMQSEAYRSLRMMAYYAYVEFAGG